MLLTWLGAAGFKVDTSEGATLLIDPYLSRPDEASPRLSVQLADLSPIDEILLTNGRFDHGLDTPALTQQTGAIVHAPESVCYRLANMGVSPHCLQCTIPRKTKRLGSLVWQALPSLVNQIDSSPILRALLRSPQILPQVKALDHQWPLGEMVAYFFQIEGLSLVHFGSAGWLEAEIDHLQPDIALLPVESDPAPDAAVIRLASLLKPKVVIPHHWDDYFPPLSRMIDLQQFETVMHMVAPEVKVYVPTIGQSFNPAKIGSRAQC